MRTIRSSLRGRPLNLLFQINRGKNCFDSDTLLLIISALVFRKLKYCSTVERCHPQTSRKCKLYKTLHAQLQHTRGNFSVSPQSYANLNGYLLFKCYYKHQLQRCTYKCVNRLHSSPLRTCAVSSVNFQRCMEVKDAIMKSLTIPTCNLPLVKGLSDLGLLRFGMIFPMN